MAKEKLSKEELEKKKINLEKEIEALESAIKATDAHAFDLIIAEIKHEMENNIAEEDWRTLKQNQKKIEAFNQIEQVIESQSDLLDKKQEELEDVIYDLEHLQLTIDDIPLELNDNNEKTATGIKLNNGDKLETGDIYKTVLDDKDTGETIGRYYLIKKSAEFNDKFAILSNYTEGELLLNYPANKKLIDEATYYVGNIYNSYDSDQNKAVECLKIIADYQAQFNQKSEDTTSS